MEGLKGAQERDALWTGSSESHGMNLGRVALGKRLIPFLLIGPMHLKLDRTAIFGPLSVVRRCLQHYLVDWVQKG
jgi:hypothetical protein